jgi:peroxiredoxin
MLAYQAGIAKFEGVETKVFAISTDNTPSLKVFAQQVKATFPMLSDFADRHVASAYGILIKQMGFANRATFVVDRDGKIQSIEEGSSALDPSGAEKTCSLIFHKK